MKKYFIIAMILLGGANLSTVQADPEEVYLQIIRETEVGQTNPKMPVRPLVITQDSNVLTLPATPVDYMLELRDENGTLVYYAFIPMGTTQIVLPTTLSGDFEIRLVADIYYYIGYLTL